MININEVIETNKMIDKENLDVRTITIGISLLDCMDSNLDTLNENIYNKITTVAKDLVKVGKDYDDGKRFGCDRRRNWKRIWSSDCKQTNFRYTNCIDWWLCVQDTG